MLETLDSTMFFLPFASHLCLFFYVVWFPLKTFSFAFTLFSFIPLRLLPLLFFLGLSTFSFAVTPSLISLHLLPLSFPILRLFSSYALFFSLIAFFHFSFTISYVFFSDVRCSLFALFASFHSSLF